MKRQEPAPITRCLAGTHSNHWSLHLQFERGTISYLITATLTRPTSINPTTSCERKIYLVEKLDVGPLTAPRARTIYLEPIPKKTRKKKQPVPTVERAGSVTSDQPEGASVVSENDSTRAQETSMDGSSVWVVGEDVNHDGVIHPMSPVGHSDLRSEISGDSAPTDSTSTGHSRGAETAAQKRDSGSLQAAAAPRGSAVEDRTITATIELLRGGCLPGDMVSVKISVQHIKRIKSMHGVIVTLYRQGRIDSSPPLSLFRGHVSKEDATRLEKEEYYPKSRTGLGGLSLSSAGSCSVFRKDLSQAFNPLIIDPVSLTASVTTSVRVPEDAFPTIKGIPGELISFKYQLEVIVDLGGKLASQIQSGQSGRTGGIGPPAAVPITVNPYEGGAASLASWGGRPIDTDRLRREKGVISVSFEVIVGTENTSRQRGKSIMRGASSIFSQQIEDPVPYEATHDGYRNEKGVLRDGFEGIPDETPGYEQEFGPLSTEPTPAEAPAPFYVPPPQLPDERGLTEKERIRQAEQRLLPSQPDPSPIPGPSAPPDLDGANIYDAEDEPVAGPSNAPPPPLPRQATVSHEAEAPSAPTLDDLVTTNHPDDKQELERQRLLNEASAPPEVPEDYDVGNHSAPARDLVPTAAEAGPSAPASSFEPSAPALPDDEHYGQQYAYQDPGPEMSTQAAAVPEELPRYER